MPEISIRDLRNHGGDIVTVVAVPHQTTEFPSDLPAEPAPEYGMNPRRSIGGPLLPPGSPYGSSPWKDALPAISPSRAVPCCPWSHCPVELLELQVRAGAS